MSRLLNNTLVLVPLVGAVVCAASFSGCVKRSTLQGEYKRPLSAKEEADIAAMRKLEALKAKSPEYLALPAKVQLTTEPYINKKIALFKTWQGSQGPEQELQNYYAAFNLPGEEAINEALAKSPDDVGTIVLVEDNTKEKGCKEIPKGNYKDPETGDIYGGYVEVCELTIIDHQIPAVIFRKKFEGKLDDKEYVRKDAGRILGRVDYAEVYKFLTGLPRK